MVEQKDSLNINKAILFVTDDNFIKSLIAQMNSAMRYFPESKIYLVHDLSPKNFAHIEDYVHKSERFDKSIWNHLTQQYGHVTKTNQGKLQVDFIEENNLLYMDTDAIINKRFAWEYPSTMTLDIKKHPIGPDLRFHKELQLLREFVLEEGGITEPAGNFTLFTDGAFFVNRDWMTHTLIPTIIEISKKYTKKGLPHRWYAMEYFHAAICILGQPVSQWKIKQALPGIHYMAKKYPHLIPYETVEECDIVHYLSYRKPWDFNIGEYPLDGGLIWWNAYLSGPINPLEEDGGLEKKLKELTS